jgi:hypothetical protein
MTSIIPASHRIEKTRITKSKNFPEPRYGFDLAFNSSSLTFYLFGGNPNEKEDTKFRLGDLWELKL